MDRIPRTKWPRQTWLGELGSVRSWVYPILLAGVALGFDAGNRKLPYGVLSTGPLDEVAHLATAALGLLVLACFIDVPRRFYVSALVASVAIDLDHVPFDLGLLADQIQRPATHSLATVAVAVVAAAASRRSRAVLAGAATGLLLHFARDITEGQPGVRMLWPLQDTAWTASYWWCLGTIIAFTAARLVLAGTGIPHTRIHLFQTPPPSCSTSQTSVHSFNPGDSFPEPGPEIPDLKEGSSGRLGQGDFGPPKTFRTHLRPMAVGLYIAHRASSENRI